MLAAWGGGADARRGGAEVLMLDAWDNVVGAGKAATGKIGGIRVLRIPSADFVDSAWGMWLLGGAAGAYVAAFVVGFFGGANGDSAGVAGVNELEFAFG